MGAGMLSERICLWAGSYYFAVEEDDTEIYKNGAYLTTLNQGDLETHTLASGDKLTSTKPFSGQRAADSYGVPLASTAITGKKFGRYIGRNADTPGLFAVLYAQSSGKYRVALAENLERPDIESATLGGSAG